MKKILVITAIALLAAACSKQSNNNSAQPTPTPTPAATPTPTPTGSNVQTYSNGQYNFSIQYGDGFDLSNDYNQVKALSYIPTCDQTMVACAYLPHKSYPNTNFDSAAVSVNIQTAYKTQAQCYSFNDPTSEAQGTSTQVSINGVTFYSAAGHFDKLQIYRNFHNNLCYELDQHVAQTDIGVYTPGTVIQFDENEVWQKLQAVVNSFIFTK